MNADNIEEILKAIGAEDVPAGVHKIAQETANNFSRSLERSTQPKQPTVWEYIMRSRVIKLAAAAVVVIAVVLAINPGGKLTPAVYALEQTIQANHTVRSLYIRSFTDGQDEPKEFWVECDEAGQISSARLQMPEWASPEDGAKAGVWKDGTVRVWFKRKNVLFVARDETVAKGMLKMVEDCDPRLALERLYAQEQQGNVKIEIDESPGDQPITVTATYLPGSSTPNKREVLIIDRATKLVTAVESYRLAEGEYQHTGRLEYCNYNEPIDAAKFMLDNEVPADVMRVDQTAQDVGMVQGNLTDEEVAVEVVRRFFEALIAADYAKAGTYFEGVPAQKMQELFSPIKIVRIVSVGPAGPHPIPATKGLAVPCTVETLKDGQLSEWKLDGVGVRQVFNQPGRWTIFGGI